MELLDWHESGCWRRFSLRMAVAEFARVQVTQKIKRDLAAWTYGPPWPPWDIREVVRIPVSQQILPLLRGAT